MGPLFNSTGYSVYHNNIIRGEGCYVYDDKGKKYLDLESGVWVLPLGHCDSDVNAAIHQQIDRITHCGYKYNHKITEICAYKLLEIVNYLQGKCVFLSSGSEAVEYGVQLAKSLRTDKKCVCLKNQYFSAYGNCKQKQEQEWRLIDWDYQESKSVEQYYREITAKIDFTEIGVFVFESGNSSGLVKLPPKNLVQALNVICKENNVIIVVDEVTSGIGRTGKWFGYMHYDLQPHIIAVGKGLGNGYPVSGVIIDASIAKEAEKAGFHYAQSHQNDPLGCKVAYEVLMKIERENLLEHTNEVASYFMEKYKELQQEFSVISEVRGVGLLLCMELSHTIPYETMLKIERDLFEQGMVVGVNPTNRVIRTYCPLIITTNMIDQYIDVVRSVLGNV